MLNEFYQNLPSFIDPVAFSIGSFSIRWYSLSYMAGFFVVYAILCWRISQGEFPGNIRDHIRIKKGDIEEKDERSKTVIEKEFIFDFLILEFFGMLIGGRLGYVLLYNHSYFWKNPSAVIWPFDGSGKFVGLYGMSYFGALVGVLVAGWIFCRIKKMDFLRLADFVIVAVPAGYFFGRIGNFLNGELYGRVTTSPLGMYFSSDPSALRHPSQLYEAFFEGILLFMFLLVLRKKNLFGAGSLLFLYLFGYGTARFVIEFSRQPDLQLEKFFTFLTIGQALSLLTIFIASILFVFLKSKKCYN